MRELMIKLIKAAERFVEDNTNTSLTMITHSMCERAKKAIEEMTKAMESSNILAFNKALVKLYSAIPRSMKNRDFLEFTPDGLEKRLNWETEFLEAVEGAVKGISVKGLENDEESLKAQKIIEKYGLSGEVVSEEDLKVIRKFMGEDASKLRRAWKVSNTTTEKNFANCTVQNRKMLWHGSDTGNFLSILTNGLSLSKARYGMFGLGIYFAEDFSKSRGYCSAQNCKWRGGNDSSAMLGIFEVAMGKPLHLNDADGTLHAGSIKLKDKNCVWAHRGKSLIRDEIVIYNENQCTIRYIVETA